MIEEPAGKTLLGIGPTLPKGEAGRLLGIGLTVPNLDIWKLTIFIFLNA